MNNIILTGFMGCGKTTVGIRLSYKIQKTFIDTDKKIEKEQNTKVKRIFENYGETYFRDLETQLLQKMVTKKDSQIISIGGGMPVREENRILLKQLGTIIFLKASPETIYERVKHDKKRPLLQGENPMAKISALCKQRNTIYESIADFTVVTDGKRFDEVIKEICELLKFHRNDKNGGFDENINY